MPIHRKLDCADALAAIKSFIGGASTKALAEHFQVTRLTITRIIKRETYKDCKKIAAFLPDDYLSSVKERMRENTHRGRGKRVEVGIV